MIELGQYANSVLSAYAITLLLLFGIIWLSITQSKRSKARLAAAEAAQSERRPQS